MNKSLSEIAKYYNKVAKEYDHSHSVATVGAHYVMNKQTWPRFRKILKENDSILEIGSGTGFLTSFLNPQTFKVISGDISFQMLCQNKTKNS